ncbi:hypothetical protein DBR06_SOUSAS8810060, partial [Sousa chinensis]
RPGFASANSRLFALAPPESFTCAEAAAEAGPSLTPSRGRGLVASGRPRHSYNCFRTLKRGVSFSPGRRRACPEAQSVGAQAKLQPRSFGEELESPGAESAHGARPGIVWQKESTCCLRHSPVVLAKAALVEFSFRFWHSGNNTYPLPVAPRDSTKELKSVLKWPYEDGSRTTLTDC